MSAKSFRWLRFAELSSRHPRTEAGYKLDELHLTDADEKTRVEESAPGRISSLGYLEFGLLAALATIPSLVLWVEIGGRISPRRLGLLAVSSMWVNMWIALTAGWRAGYRGHTLRAERDWKDFYRSVRSGLLLMLALGLMMMLTLGIVMTQSNGSRGIVEILSAVRRINPLLWMMLFEWVGVVGLMGVIGGSIVTPARRIGRKATHGVFAGLTAMAFLYFVLAPLGVIGLIEWAGERIDDMPVWLGFVGAAACAGSAAAVTRRAGILWGVGSAAVAFCIGILLLMMLMLATMGVGHWLFVWMCMLFAGLSVLVGVKLRPIAKKEMVQ